MLLSARVLRGARVITVRVSIWRLRTQSVEKEQALITGNKHDRKSKSHVIVGISAHEAEEGETKGGCKSDSHFLEFISFSHPGAQNRKPSDVKVPFFSLFPPLPSSPSTSRRKQEDVEAWDEGDHTRPRRAAPLPRLTHTALPGRPRTPHPHADAPPRTQRSTRRLRHLSPQRRRGLQCVWFV